jgi:mannosyltransferase OCH1-like enzyme
LIPKIIHQTWKTTELPLRWQRYRKAWKRLHPDWEFRFWTDDDNMRLVEKDYPGFLDLYNSYEYPILKADFARILYLHKFGGLYADLDLEPLKPLDHLIEKPCLVMGTEKGGMGMIVNNQDFIINACMASPKGHRFWEMLLERLHVTFRRKRFLESRGNYVMQTIIFELDKMAREYQRNHNDIMIHPSEIFYPRSWYQSDSESQRRKALEIQSYTIHHYDTTWYSGGMLIVKRLLRGLYL